MIDVCRQGRESSSARSDYVPKSPCTTSPGVLVDIRQERKYTRSSWLNCALRDDEAVCWVGIGHYEAVAVGN